MSSPNSFRIGKVTGYLRGRVWYLCYFENGQRRRPVSDPTETPHDNSPPASTTNSNPALPSAFSFEPLSITALARAMARAPRTGQALVRVHSINRYRTATEHLLRFLNGRPLRHAGIVLRYPRRSVRSVRDFPERATSTPKRPLLDKGVRYVLECCRAMFNYAARHRHLPPYTDNPFTAIEIDRIPRRDGTGDRIAHARAGASVPRGVRRLAVPHLPDSCS